MNRKLKITLVVLVVIGLLIAIPLIVLSFGRVDVGYVALTYDNILGNYSSTAVYEPGMHFIGVARSFIRIKQSPTLLNVEAQTYTSDYFRLNSRIVVTYQIQNSRDFSALDNFYINFGQRPEEMIGWIAEKKIVSVLSQNPSSFYQNSFNTSGLQTTIDTALTNVFTFELGTELLIEVLIESLVVEGASTSAQAVAQQIQNSLVQLKRAQNQKVEISSLIQRINEKSNQQIKTALQIISQRVQLFNLLYAKAANPPTISIPNVLFGNSVVRGNLSFFSSQLRLRPQLYAANQTIVF